MGQRSSSPTWTMVSRSCTRVDSADRAPEARSSDSRLRRHARQVTITHRGRRPVTARSSSNGPRSAIPTQLYIENVANPSSATPVFSSPTGFNDTEPVFDPADPNVHRLRPARRRSFTCLHVRSGDAGADRPFRPGQWRRLGRRQQAGFRSGGLGTHRVRIRSRLRLRAALHDDRARHQSEPGIPRRTKRPRTTSRDVRSLRMTLRTHPRAIRSRSTASGISPTGTTGATTSPTRTTSGVDGATSRSSLSTPRVSPREIQPGSVMIT